MSKRWMVLVGLAASMAVSQPVRAMTSPFVQERDELKAELEKKLAAVDENDANALFEIAMWADANGLKTDAKRTLRKVIRADTNHAEARKLLGYVLMDDKWVTEREAERLQKKKEDAEKEAMGLKKWDGDGEWYPAETVEKLEKGLRPIEVDGQEVWVTEREKGFLEQGLVPYKGQWIKAEDKAKIDQGLFPVGDKWLTEEEADKAHSVMDSPWVLESDHNVLTTTCSHAFGEKSLINARRAIERSYQLLDMEMPEEFGKIDLVLVRTVDDYNNIGNAAQDDHDATMSSVYGCFSFQNPETLSHMGVALYSVIDASNDEANDNYTLFLVRHAAAEAAVRNMRFEEEVPRWLITGIATYCERFWDPFNSNGSARLAAWSLENLQREGGLKSLKSFFEPFSITRQTLIQSGLLLSFLKHGQLPESVDGQWTKVKEMLRSDKQKGLAKEFLKLESVLAKDGQKAFEAYAESISSAN